ncbi:MAG: hypothetical protein ABL921_15640 [Pirellula sp.]
MFLPQRGPDLTPRVHIEFSSASNTTAIVRRGPTDWVRLHPDDQCAYGHRRRPPRGVHGSGNQRGINGGAFFVLRPPGSGLELDLPLIGQFPDGDRPDAGLQADIDVVTTVKDIAQGRDAELETVRARLRLPAQPPLAPVSSPK